MPQLPRNVPLELLGPRWAAILDPVIASPMAQVSILKGVSLISGVNVIDHLLGRKQQGWFITDINAAAQIYRSAPFNGLQLTLTSNAACVADIGVF